MNLLSTSVRLHTIGNATSILEESGKPILVTDPWLHTVPAYFGSWTLTHEIPEFHISLLEQCPYIWISHFHPDHLSLRSLLSIDAKSKTILLSRQYRNRIAFDLRRLGFKVLELPPKQWLSVSDSISISTYPVYETVDSVLLVRSKGQIVVNLNDTYAGPGSRFLKESISASSDSLLLKLAGYGDADMINIFRDGHTFVEPCAAGKPAPGAILTACARKLNIKSAMHFSSFHQYSRSDSYWANKYTTPESDLSRGWDNRVCYFPHFSTLDLTDSRFVLSAQASPKRFNPVLRKPSQFLDDWSQTPNDKQRSCLASYLYRVNTLLGRRSFLSFRVGDALVSESGGITCYSHHLAARTSCMVLHSPLHSLLIAVRLNIFDDLLISNFPRLLIFGRHVNYSRALMFPAKYLDNLYISSADDLKSFWLEQRASYDSVSGYYSEVLARSLRGSVLSALSGRPVLLSILKSIYQRI